MDFNSVLSMAKDNKRYASNEIPVKRYSTDVPPPKKTQKNAVQSDAIKQFLAKRKKEEHFKTVEAERRKQELLDLRAKAKHNRKATQMATRTKDNNFMATFSTAEQLAAEAAAAEKIKIQDTSDRYRYFKPPRVGADPSVVAHRPKMVSLEPPPQPQINQTKNGHRVRTDPPQPPPQPQINQTKNGHRVRTDLPLSPPPRHAGVNSKTIDQFSATSDNREKVSGGARAIKRPAAPPPPNFYDLLQLAAKKQHEPVDLPKIPKKMKDEDVQGRLMTSDEKRRFLEEQTRKQGRSLSSVQLPASAKRRRKFRENEEREEYVAETLTQPKCALQQAKPAGQATKSSTGNVPKKPPHLQNAVPERTKVSNGEQPSSRGPAPQSRDRVLKNAACHNGLRISKVESLAGQTTLSKTGPIVHSNDRPSRPVKTKSGPSNDVRMKAPISNARQSREMKAPFSNERQSREMKAVRDVSSAASSKHSDSPSKFPPQSKWSLPVKGNEPRQRLVSSQCKEKLINTGFGKAVVAKKPLAPRDNMPMQRMSRDKAPGRQTMQQETLDQRTGSRDSMGPKAFQSRESMQKQLQSRDAVQKRLPPRDIVQKQFPPRDIVQKQFPPRDLVPKRFAPDDVRRPPPPRPGKRRIESDDEYDEEMDDFIDDGPIDDGSFNYSEHIKQIFGYDRARYQYEPEDDGDCMESSFAQMMREEAISTKIGILEDLEDIRREQLELERKAQQKRRK